SKILVEDMNIKYPGRLNIDGLEFNDVGKNGDETPGDGIYTALIKELKKEGMYVFDIEAADTSNGNNIRWKKQMQKYVRVNIKAKKFIKKITRVDTLEMHDSSLLKDQNVYKVSLKLRDKLGNVPSPNALNNIELSLNKGKIIGSIQANLDGSFTQLVSFPKNIKPRQIKMTMMVYGQVGVKRLAHPIPLSVYIIGGFIIILIIVGFIKRKK
ncbi:choice-of-anchor X domain-containing protein, partial [Bacteroidota bacterium]